MANYIPYARSNTFRIKNFEEFSEFISNFEITMYQTDPTNDPTLVTMYPEEGWPDGNFDDDGEWCYVDFYDALVPYLAKNAVAVLQEVGHEKLRYLVGMSVAVHSDGSVLAISIDDIYAKCSNEFGGDIELHCD